MHRYPVRLMLVSTLVVSLMPVVPPTAAAGARAITGKLSKRGFTVVAIAANGEARVAKGKGKPFRLKPPARVVTLHLRARDGTYAGPIVIRREGKRSILGLRPGARLGRVVVRNGYGLVKRSQPDAVVDASLWAKARKGIPIGVGKIGLGGSKRTKPRVRGDRDRDGIPNSIDIDDDGDRVLDNLEPQVVGANAPTGWLAAEGTNGFGLHARLALPIWETANVNAGSTAAEVDAAAFDQRLDIQVLPGDQVELDCGGLPYCSSGGTGAVHCGECVSEEGWPPFPDCCDPDGDGFGTLEADGGGFGLAPRALTSQIGTGDVLIQRVQSGGTETQFASTLQFVFGTVPALASYRDTAGHQGQVSYPVTGPDPGPPEPGADGNGFVVAPGPGGDVVVDLTLWRPQRRSVGTEPGTWMDIGGLIYQAGVFTDVPGEGLVAKMCPASSFSEQDPDLAPPVGLEGGGGGISDLAPARAADPANTLTYTLNLTACLSGHGIAWSSGQEHRFTLLARAAAGDSAEQDVAFQHA